MDTTRSSDDVLLARELVAKGFGYAELSRLVRRGELEHLRRGAYAPHSTDGLNDVDRHRRLVRATMAMLARGVLSHRSAAVLHGLPLPRGGLELVQVTQPEAASGRRRGHVHRFASPLDPAEVSVIDGVPVTDLARTVVDLGRTLRLADAVAAADAALRQGLDPVTLGTALAGARGRPGVADARRVVAFADGRSESAGESHSRVLLHRIGLAPSSLQHEVHDDLGRLVGRSDFVWEAERTLGEFDGRVKYGRLLGPGQPAGDVLWAEKQRRTRCVTWAGSRALDLADLARPGVLGDRIRRAFARSAR